MDRPLVLAPSNYSVTIIIVVHMMWLWPSPWAPFSCQRTRPILWPVTQKCGLKLMYSNFQSHANGLCSIATANTIQHLLLHRLGSRMWLQMERSAYLTNILCYVCWYLHLVLQVFHLVSIHSHTQTDKTKPSACMRSSYRKDEKYRIPTITGCNPFLQFYGTKSW